MCETNINPSDPFADIDESEFEAELARVDERRPTVSAHSEDIGNVEIPGFVEDCPKCNGSGVWHGYSRHGRQCFKCKGLGKLTFKTSPEARGKARKYAAKRKVKQAEETVAAFDAWLIAECPDVAEWIRKNPGNNFAQSLVAGGHKYGHLTEGQVAGVRKAIARDDDAAGGAAEFIKNHEAEHAWLVRESAAGNEFAESLLNGQYGLMKRGVLSENQLNAVRKNLEKDGDPTPSALDISSLKGYYAVPDGDTRLKLCVRRPGKNSRYHGWTFVDDGAGYGRRTTYGKQTPDGTYQGSVQDALKAILADPYAAQVAYGKLTGTCGTCGRLLEDEASVAAGIGPICAAKFG